MKYCKKCVMPDTRPGIKFDEEGVCYPCRSWERRKQIDWGERWKELEKLADKYRGSNGDYYDCIITVSGGKDSHFQTYIFKEKLKMNSLLVNVDNFSWTETGRHNMRNLNERFGCDVHSISLNRKVARKAARKGLEKELIPNWYWDKAVYAYSLRAAIAFDIPLIVFGENINYEYGGRARKDIRMKDLNPAVYPSPEEIKKAKLEPIYLSYFVPWDGYKNFKLATKYGFKSLDDEWKRVGVIDNYEQIDTIGYLVHTWFKFIKYGHARVTDVASQWIRAGRMTREEAVKLVNKEDYKLDRRMLADFLDITEEYFWKVVDKFANREILKKRDGVWRLKESGK